MNFSIKPISNFVNSVKTKVRDIIVRRKQVQENFRKRKDNSNYYGGTQDFQ